MAIRPYEHSIPWTAPYHTTPSSGTAGPSHQRQERVQYQKSNSSTSQNLRGLFPSLYLPTRPEIADHSLQQNPAELLPPINLTTQSSRHCLQISDSSQTQPLVEPASFLPVDSYSSPQVLEYNPAPDNPKTAKPDSDLPQTPFVCSNTSWRQPYLHRSSGSRELRQRAGWPLIGPRHTVQAGYNLLTYRPTGSPDINSIDREQPITPSRKPRLWIEASSSEEIVEEAQLTTVTSPSKPRLVTISPRTPLSKKNSSRPITPQIFSRALVSAFSPDTPPETPDVANRSDEDAEPTHQNVEEQRLASSDTQIFYPFTPPNSRIPTPFDKIRSSASACLQDRPCWVSPTMTQLDPSTTWILEELEGLLADLHTTALRLNMPVINRIRAATSGASVPDASSRQRSSLVPHSRYSPYRPLSSHPISTQSPLQRERAPQANPTVFTLQTIFPQARHHHLDSLQATYLALQFVTNLPSSDFAIASASDTAASPFTASIERSRSSSLVSNVPAKARAMLGLDSPMLSPAPIVAASSPATSWFRANSPELDSDVKVRLENVELLLETSVRKILAEIEGRPIGKPDDALVRAVGEVIRMGERRNGTARL
ncbi:MAG: hypothetical protein Q9213_003897 [Squamulea squamosa]